MLRKLFGSPTSAQTSPNRSKLESVCKKPYGMTLNTNRTQLPEQLEFLAALCRNECCIIDWHNLGTDLFLMKYESDKTFTCIDDVKIVNGLLNIGSSGRNPTVYDLKTDVTIFKIFANYMVDSGVLYLSIDDLMNLVAPDGEGGGSRKSSTTAKWVCTARKVSVKSGKGKPMTHKTVYRNSNTGELRVRKITVHPGGSRRISYVKFK